MTTETVEWTVFTWNLQGSRRTDMGRVVEVIGAESPDVVAVQEVRRSQAAELADALAMSHEWVFKHHPLLPFLPDRAEGAALFTPHSLGQVSSAVVSRTTSRRSYRRRVAQWGVVSRADATGYRVLNVHLSPHDRPDDRLGEARRIAQIAQGFGDAPPIVVAGDLNNDGEPSVTAALPGVEHVTPGPTNPSSDPVQRLDHVLLPAEATAVSTSVPGGGRDWSDLSDHLPVTVRFGLDWVRGDIVG